MIVSFSLIRRRADLSSEAFRAHWLDPHGPLTARIPGTMRYVQNHVIDGPGTNQAARDLRVDGFPQLAFDSSESRVAAHGSPEIAACNVDSRSFIGGVSRVITDDGDAPVPSAAGLIKQIMLTTIVRDRTTRQADVRALLDRLEIEAMIPHQVLEQAAAPNSTIPHHGIEVDTLDEVWIRDENAVRRNAAMLQAEMPELAVFQVRPYVFL